MVMDELDPERNTKTPTPPRTRLMRSCVESILAVAESAYRRVEASRCAAGCLARAVHHVAAPVLRPLQLQVRPRCLSALSFIDRQLAVAQDVAAVLFPPTERVLGKVDGLVLLVESLPVRFDCAVDGLEALVTYVRSGFTVGLVPAEHDRRDAVVFRVIRLRCDKGAGGAAHRDVETMCKGASPEAGTLDDATVTVDGSGRAEGNVTVEAQYGDAEMARSDMGNHHHFRPDSDETGHDDDAAQAAYSESVHGDAEKQEPSSGECEGAQMNMSADVSGMMEAQTFRSLGAMPSAGVVKVETQQAVSPEAGSTSEAGEASGNESKDLLDLFDEAWQLKLA